ncbi:restriction endonuclease subunit S [Streptomyces macrosporus]|uniref:Type I restriction modification DNA specificity domain-containing protein n=1 Tax=Streptomyces macrosporus TaxID=44032 RepID=A0ABP5WLF1_9ACTN
MNDPVDRSPAEWREVPLGDVCEFLQVGHSSATVRPDRHVTEGVPLVRAGDIGNRRISSAAISRLPGDLADDLGQYRLRPGDVLCTRAGTVGRVALVSEKERDWLFSTHLVRIRTTEELLIPEYLVSYLASPMAAAWIDARSTGSTIRHISVRVLRDLPVPLPPVRIQRDIGEQLAALDEKIRVHTEIARTTAEIRDVLADLLFTDLVEPR